MNAGIDYGMGTANIDKATGIRYGVISQHAINGDSLGSLWGVYAGPHCPQCDGEVTDEIAESMQAWEKVGDCEEYACVSCEKVYESSYCYSDEAIGLEYKDAEYYIIDCLDSDLMVIRSPYYTHAQFCSPCVPGAGSLESPSADGVRAYCLGADWFDGNPPYPIYLVADRTLLFNPEEKAIQQYRILRNGIEQAIVPENGLMDWFHNQHSFSMEHALQCEGYTVEKQPIAHATEKEIAA